MRKEKKKKRKRIKEQESITRLNQKGAKTLRSVAAFLCKKLNESEVKWQKFWKKIF